jgi:hypothetical protein
VVAVAVAALPLQQAAALQHAVVQAEKAATGRLS